ncbi:hypothetical protein Dalk_4427 [Desulfatibacillum aliphaticivorans]|uniref:PsbP C-terminal domain-containing protein n=1 Tax=Desulfatibacillum aliphaticivorans TaxID=218208 RepID=B8FND7_DESAL|nr:hypothetical protein [Desulfatibacillum aliphaticivorans]ACL06106.1 hypothetical protein Dalk_4427 [Desulfatibacillum aliphaticivorans]
MKYTLTLLLSLLLVATGFAEIVPGTGVDINPPANYIPSDRVTGFMNMETGASIVVMSLPGPYDECMKGGVMDPEEMRAKGVVIISQTPAVVDGNRATLISAKQFVNSVLYKKWILVTDRSSSTIFLMATYPADSPEREGVILKNVLLKAVFTKPSAPLENLKFSVTAHEPFEIVEFTGQNVGLLPRGKFPIEDCNTPFMVAGLSLTLKYDVSDRKAFVEKRIKNVASVKDVSIQSTKSIKIGELSGYVTMAIGKDEDTRTPMTIYQVILFDEDGYCMIMGLTPEAKRKEYLPTFQKIAESFRLKE